MYANVELIEVALLSYKRDLTLSDCQLFGPTKDNDLTKQTRRKMIAKGNVYLNFFKEDSRVGFKYIARDGESICRAVHSYV